MLVTMHASAGFKTGTQAAAAGGVTTVIDMPLNNVPATTTGDLVLHKLHASQVWMTLRLPSWACVGLSIKPAGMSSANLVNLCQHSVSIQSADMFTTSHLQQGLAAASAHAARPSSVKCEKFLCL